METRRYSAHFDLGHDSVRCDVLYMYTFSLIYNSTGISETERAISRAPWAHPAFEFSPFIFLAYMYVCIHRLTRA